MECESAGRWNRRRAHWGIRSPANRGEFPDQRWPTRSTVPRGRRNIRGPRTGGRGNAFSIFCQWDSQTAGRFPAAIEVVFDLQTQGEQAEQEETIGDDLANGETEEASSLILAGDEELPWDVLDEDAEEFAYEYRFVIAIDSAGSLGDPRKRETP